MTDHNTSDSYRGSLVSRAFSGVIIGIILFFASFPLLICPFSLDGLAAKKASPVAVSLPSEQPDSSNNGKLIHISGLTSTDEVLSDEIFYLSVNAVKLQRVVEMYQWQEDDFGKAYHQAWATSSVNSGLFRHPQGHGNPKMPLRGSEYSTSSLKVGGFTLTSPFIEQVRDYVDYPIDPTIYAKINPALTGFKLHGSEYYHGSNPEIPSIGDVRVRFRIVKPGETLSVIGMQNNDHIETFFDENGHIALVNNGYVDASTMQGLSSTGALLVWSIRLGGVIMMVFGLMLINTAIKKKREKARAIPHAVKYFKVPRSALSTPAE